jgi:hypothetical protein
MQFTLMGFHQETAFRVFAFTGVAEDRSRTSFTVRADLALSRRYGIQLQELPLLCVALLERSEHADLNIIFTEDDMRLHASDRSVAKEEAERRRASRRPKLFNRPGTNPNATPGVALAPALASTTTN